MPKRDYELSLNELAKGDAVSDIYGYISSELGDRVFKITRIQLASGCILDVEGEHDFPYVCDDVYLDLPCDNE